MERKRLWAITVNGTRLVMRPEPDVQGGPRMPYLFATKYAATRFVFVVGGDLRVIPVTLRWDSR